MGLRQKEWAKRARKALLDKYGDKCAKCGAKRNLTLDCIAPMGDAHHRLDFARRTSFYRRQDQAGNLQILCKYHNEVKGNKIPF